MTAFTIQDVSRRSGLSEPTLRYYEEVGLIGPVGRARGRTAAAWERIRVVTERMEVAR
jgi:hypothetical protein